MNKNAAIAITVIALAAIGSIVYFSMKNNVPAPAYNTATTATSVTTTNTTPPVQTNRAGVPVVVTSTIVFPTDSTAIVNGSVKPEGALTSYWYEYGTNSSLGSKTAAQTVGSGFVTIGAPGYITGLVTNNNYYYRLVAENQYGRVSGTMYTFQTKPGNPPVIGSAPAVKTISSSNVSRTTANLNGQVNQNQSSTQYWFEYGTTASLGNTTPFISIGSGNTNMSVSTSLSGLEPLTTYYFRLNAQNQFGTVNGSILSFKTAGPANPATPVVTTKNESNVTSVAARLNATVNPEGAATTYWFDYNTNSLLGGVLLSSTAQKSLSSGQNDVSVFTDISGLAPDTTYYFRVVAQNSMGTVHGNILSFKTKAR